LLQTEQNGRRSENSLPVLLVLIEESCNHTQLT
jgi:hypothetical protein